MSPPVFFIVTLLSSVAAGLLGALLGLGGGVIIVPVLTLAMGINIHYAIGASIVSVIATSSGAASAYVRDGLTNLRVGMFLETATTTGAITGALLAGLLAGRYLYLIFGLVLLWSGWVMLHRARLPQQPDLSPDRWAERLSLEGEYYDPATGRTTAYRAHHTGGGLALMFVAGTVSGLLGIGSGILKVLAMDMVMRLPMKVSSATSNFMIGVTAAASAGIYFLRGDLNPFITAPVALGVLGGAILGTRLLLHLHSDLVKKIFIAVLALVAIEMLLRGLGVNV